MSLLTSASPWTNDNISKKRMPSLRKTLKKQMPIKTDFIEEEDEGSSNSLNSMPSLDEIKVENKQNEERIQKIINAMNEVKENEDGSSLSDFKPLSHPVIKDRNQVLGKEAESEIPRMDNDLLPNNVNRIEKTSGNFSSSQPDLNASSNPYHVRPFSNYGKIYRPPSVSTPSQYYQKFPASQTNNASLTNHKLMEKINYMIHLLEQQQNEKTSNITEEFILYVFLGIFIIFIVDSFSRGNSKYIR